MTLELPADHESYWWRNWLDTQLSVVSFRKHLSNSVSQQADVITFPLKIVINRKNHDLKKLIDFHYRLNWWTHFCQVMV